MDAALSARVFGIDISYCLRCGAALPVLAVFSDPRIRTASLRHIDAPAARARLSPELDWTIALRAWAAWR